ncbi:cytochrome b-c1 complex subunit 6, mitochondrial-like [Choristoneura fumiferana]|uniref:cytochrome b-c1 complex subunit 6, mitochondrial-like n=1 Tax=Choristoneura fumiferana TaxID=7141 RepID=UPI003D15391B
MSEGEAEEKEMWDMNSDDPLIRARGICMFKNCDVRKIIKELQDCQTRVANKPYTAETCQQELTDLVMAVDHCVGHKAFGALK